MGRVEDIRARVEGRGGRGTVADVQGDMGRDRVSRIRTRVQGTEPEQLGPPEPSLWQRNLNVAQIDLERLKGAYETWRKGADEGPLGYELERIQRDYEENPNLFNDLVRAATGIAAFPLQAVSDPLEALKGIPPMAEQAMETASGLAWAKPEAYQEVAQAPFSAALPWLMGYGAARGVPTGRVAEPPPPAVFKPRLETPQATAQPQFPPRGLQVLEGGEPQVPQWTPLGRPISAKDIRLGAPPESIQYAPPPPDVSGIGLAPFPPAPESPAPIAPPPPLPPEPIFRYEGGQQKVVLPSIEGGKPPRPAPTGGEVVSGQRPAEKLQPAAREGAKPGIPAEAAPAPKPAAPAREDVLNDQYIRDNPDLFEPFDPTDFEPEDIPDAMALYRREQRDRAMELRDEEAKDAIDSHLLTASPEERLETHLADSEDVILVAAKKLEAKGYKITYNSGESVYANKSGDQTAPVLRIASHPTGMSVFNPPPGAGETIVSYDMEIRRGTKDAQEWSEAAIEDVVNETIKTYESQIKKETPATVIAKTAAPKPAAPKPAEAPTTEPTVPGVPEEVVAKARAVADRGEAGYLQLPEMQDVEKYARSINLTKIDAGQDTRNFLSAVGGLEHKRTVSLNEVRRMAEESGLEAEGLIKKLKPDKQGNVAINAPLMDRVRRVNISTFDQLTESARNIAKTGDLSQETIQKFVDEFAVAQDVFDVASNAANEWGRTGRVLAETVRPGRFIQNVRDQLGITEATLDRGKIYDLVTVLARYRSTDLAQGTKFLRDLQKPKAMDYIYEYWYNSILSGPPTHLVNSISNIVWGAWQLPHRALRGALDLPVSKLQGRPQEYYIRETLPAVIGMGHGIKSGVAKFFKMLVDGHVDTDLTKWNEEMRIGAFERSPSKLVRAVAPAITMPSRFLRAEDLLPKTIAFDSEIAATATRAAIKEGLKGDRLTQRVAELIAEPTPEMMESAGKFSNYSTFNDAPGKISEAIMGLRGKIPGGRLVIPFVRTIGNLLKRGVEMTPGVGIAIQRGNLKGAGLSDVLAKQIEGTAIALYFAQKYAEGNLTGSIPIDKAERDAFYRMGKQPWSVKYGDKWYSYRRLEPFSTVIGSVAIIGDAIRDKGEEPAQEVVLKIGLAEGRNLLDGSYLSTMSDMIGALEGGRGGQKSLENIFQRTSTGFVPYSGFLRGGTRAIEAGQQGEATLRAPSSFIEGVKSQLPFLSQDVAPRYNIWGEPITLEGGPLRQYLPYKATTESKDPVERELQRLRIYPGMPGKNYPDVPGQKKPEAIPRHLYDTMLIIGGRDAKQRLDVLIASPDYKAASDENKRKTIEREIGRARQKARQLIQGAKKWSEKPVLPQSPP